MRQLIKVDIAFFSFFAFINFPNEIQKVSHFFGDAIELFARFKRIQLWSECFFPVLKWLPYFTVTTE